MADGELIAYGYKLVVETFALIGPRRPTPPSAMLATNLACKNCHLDAAQSRRRTIGRRLKTYPSSRPRSGRVISLAERIDECMTRSMNGRKLPDASREMMGYLA